MQREVRVIKKTLMCCIASERDCTTLSNLTLAKKRCFNLDAPHHYLIKNFSVDALAVYHFSGKVNLICGITTAISCQNAVNYNKLECRVQRSKLNNWLCNNFTYLYLIMHLCSVCWSFVMTSTSVVRSANRVSAHCALVGLFTYGGGLF